MKFEKADLANCENLIRALKGAKFEVEGLEVMALADVFKWVGKMRAAIEQDLKTPPVVVNPPNAAIKESTQPVEASPAPKKGRPKKGE